MKDMITMNRTEQERAMVCTAVLSGEVGRAEAAAYLGISERQLRRVVAAYRREGPAGLVHGNRGRAPAGTLTAAQREQIITLARERYADVNDTHLSELLAQEGITVSRSTVRRLRLQAGMARPRTRRAPKHRSRRERMARAGMLVQLDGSRHRWLGQELPACTLLAAIDDATGAVVAALFREQEDAAGYLALLLGLVSGVGCPRAVYHDQHGIFVRPARDQESVAEQPRGQRDPTPVGRALQQLGIRSIRAHSPQAKGGWSGSSARGKTGWSSSCDWLGSRPWSRPMPSCRHFSPASMRASPSPPRRRRRPSRPSRPSAIPGKSAA